MAAKVTTATLNGAVRAGQMTEMGLLRTAHALNHIDDVVSGQRPVTAGAKVMEK